MLKHITLFLVLAHVAPAAAETGFLARTVDVHGSSYRYQVFIPAQWNPDEQWPVISFLHGGGERGDDGVRQLDKGLPEILREKPDFPAVVVMPQCRRRTWWGDPAMETQAFATLEATIEEFNGDRSRLYLTGLSLGGYGTWAFGYKYPK